MPPCLQPSSAVLVLTAQQRQRLLQVERPRLARQGFRLACWEGNSPHLRINSGCWTMPA